METDIPNLNYSGDLSQYLGKNFGYGGLTGLDSALGVSAGGQPTFVKDGVIYGVKDGGNGQYSVQQIDTVANRQGQFAQQQYQAQQGSAISGLQEQKSGLAGQYGSLLSSVTGRYQPLIDQATMQQNAQNASRGLVSNIGNGGTQMISALNPLYSAEAGNAQEIGQGSISDTNTLSQAIASLQSGGAATGANLGLSYGSLALAQQLQPSIIAGNLAQANAYNTQANNIPVSQGGLIFNPSSGNYNVPIQSILKSLGINLKG